MGGNLGGWTGLIVLVLIILLFGAPKLPALARSLGQSLKIFKSEVKNDGSEESSVADSDESDQTKK
jgi:sec-independent protein translocase protein TatA